MRLILILCALVVLVKAQHGDGKEYYDIKDAPRLFEKFKVDYHRVYSSPEDEAVHYSAFVETLDRINKSNAQSSSATYGINKFSDYTPEERRQLLGLKNVYETHH